MTDCVGLSKPSTVGIRIKALKSLGRETYKRAETVDILWKVTKQMEFDLYDDFSGVCTRETVRYVVNCDLKIALISPVLGIYLDTGRFFIRRTKYTSLFIMEGNQTSPDSSPTAFHMSSCLASIKPFKGSSSLNERSEMSSNKGIPVFHYIFRFDWGN